jgi:hypothetical protein
MKDLLEVSDSALTLDGLPLIPIDDDFIEFLAEEGYEDIDIEEFYVEWSIWAKKNVKSPWPWFRLW